MMRKQFTFYRSFWETIQKLPTNKEKLQAFEMICDYALDGNEPDLDSKKPTAAMVFNLCRPILEKAHRQSAAIKNANSQSPLS